MSTSPKPDFPWRQILQRKSFSRVREHTVKRLGKNVVLSGQVCILCNCAWSRWHAWGSMHGVRASRRRHRFVNRRHTHSQIVRPLFLKQNVGEGDNTFSARILRGLPGLREWASMSRADQTTEVWQPHKQHQETEGHRWAEQGQWN